MTLLDETKKQDMLSIDKTHMVKGRKNTRGVNVSGQRQNINIELSDGSKASLEDVRAWNGMTQKEMVRRLINWFCDQDRVVQQVILGQIPEEIAPDVAQIILAKMAAGETTLSRSSLVGEIPATTRSAKRKKTKSRSR